MIYSRDFSPVLNKIFGNEKGSTNYDNWYGFPFFIPMINIVSIFQDEQVWSLLSHLNKLVSNEICTNKKNHFKTIKSNIQKSVNCHLYRYKYYIYLSIALIWMFYKLICKHLAYFCVCVCVSENECFSVRSHIRSVFAFFFHLCHSWKHKYYWVWTPLLVTIEPIRDIWCKRKGRHYVWTRLNNEVDGLRCTM